MPASITAAKLLTRSPGLRRAALIVGYPATQALDLLAFAFVIQAPLARAQGRIGLQTLYERLPDLRALPGQELEFTNNVGAPSRHTLRVEFSGG